MKAKVNKVAIQLVEGNPLSVADAGLVLQTDPNLTVAEELSALAGPEVLQECVQIGWCEVGSAVITNPGQLPVERLIHVVGPRWGEGSERGKLANATWKCLQLAEEDRLPSLVMPAISTGTMGYPLENCAKTMLERIIDFTFEDPKYLRTIIICLETQTAYNVFRQEMKLQLQELKATNQGKVQV
ncbi:MAG: macro domain-containing protein [Anaerolineaceae bacterium]|nr:macro domain-containing protein [Anaerolineaceae bacterium]